MTASNQARFEQGFALHQQGRLADAEALYDQVLREQPAHQEAAHLRGLVALQSGRTAEGISCLRELLARSPAHAAAWHNLGLGLCQLGQFAEGLAGFERALALLPGHAGLHSDRGNALAALGRHEAAAASFERAVALAPDNAGAHNNLGVTLIDLRRHEEALASFVTATRLRPDYAEAWSNTGGALHQLRRHDEALAAFDRAIALNPGHAEAHCNRAGTLQALRRHAEALAACERALALNPGYVEAHVGSGLALAALGHHDEAIASYDRAIAARPGFAPAHSNRAQALFRQARFADSARAYATALRLDPNLRHVPGHLIHALQQACAWDELAPHQAAIASRLGQDPGAVAPFPSMAILDEPALHRRAAEACCAEEFPARETLASVGRRPPRGRIKLAYVSGDFHDHAVPRLAAGLFERHRREEFEILGLSVGPAADDDMRRRLASSFELFVDGRNETDRAIAETLLRHEVDIAVDLSGYTAESRPEIFSHRPAPVQVSYLGYPGTLGAPYIDYIIGDPVVTPFAHAGFFTEKIVQLPDSYQVNDRTRAIAGETPSRPELGLPENGFVFCCFNGLYKITPEMFDIWMRLLQRVDGSVLWLFHGNPEAEANLRREARRRGVAPERLVFAPRLDPARHLARHRRADLFLDTLPYNAHTTASDALWAGLPVVTCPGRAFAGRVAASLLTAVGLPELVSGSLADYEALALRLATDPAALAAVRAKLEANRLTTALFDTDRFTRHIESAYRTMHERRLRGLPPQGFAVPAGG
ncbi:MAG: tetratricopeptide repeat protein [Alphaproteobacteria bacterium]|nr:tetratricopeptide repeat protein [Alphaproteobacteria bacterium]